MRRVACRVASHDSLVRWRANAGRCGGAALHCTAPQRLQVRMMDLIRGLLTTAAHCHRL
jgi:hypothetical protein